jgi:hypothetical protein
MWAFVKFDAVLADTMASQCSPSSLDTDVSGIGVRVSFHLQTVFLGGWILTIKNASLIAAAVLAQLRGTLRSWWREEIL